MAKSAGVHFGSCGGGAAVKTLIFIFAALLPLTAQDRAKDLDNVARIGSVMVDGDVCQRILKARALNSILHPDPRDQWADGDNYDVDHEAYIRTKKTLIRLARLVDFPCDVNLWMPLPNGRIHVVIRNIHEMSQFWAFGDLHQPMVPEMKTVLDSGRRLNVTKKPGWISVLAPVANSLGEIVGVLEAVTQVKPDPYGNVK
jgi:hypothetical protein